MSLKDIALKQSYSSDFDDILTDFYLPVLSEATRYDRIAGFFSSSSLALAARGIERLVEGGGSIRILTSPRLSKEDIECLSTQTRVQESVSSQLVDAIQQSLEASLVRRGVHMLGALLDIGRLQLRIAVPSGEVLGEELQSIAPGLFHQKLGVLHDGDGNVVSFSGSLNETVFGWIHNIEEFKVFRSWEQAELQYVRSDMTQFEHIWNGESSRIRVFSIPEAVAERLLTIAHNEQGGALVAQSSSRTVQLFDYQQAAKRAWVDAGRRGILEMATGTGKTFTALGCVQSLIEETDSLCVVVTCPNSHLLQQWRTETEKFGLSVSKYIVADSTSSSWRRTLANALIDLSLGYEKCVVVLTTHRTASSQDFVYLLKQGKKQSSLCLVADEVHAVGAPKMRELLVQEYDTRLGLSATPRRWMDETGTDTLYEYFGGTVYTFTLEEAISRVNPATGQTFLTPFRYIPLFVSLNDEEMAEYARRTASIVRMAHIGAGISEDEQLLSQLLFQRANIVKAAAAKYAALESILNKLGESAAHVIIYCAPQQMDEVGRLLHSKPQVSAHTFTMEEKAKPEARFGGMSERTNILRQFAEKRYQVLIAMKCLDEGVDVPAARTAIFLASSGNPREYIQRIGRVIRRSPDKEEATIFDVIVKPRMERLSGELRQLELRVFGKEVSRYEEISRLAINSVEALIAVSAVRDSLYGG